MMKDCADYRAAEMKLLRARILEGFGETDLALTEYRDAVNAAIGVEARRNHGLKRIATNQSGRCGRTQIAF